MPSEDVRLLRNCLIVLFVRVSCCRPYHVGELANTFLLVSYLLIHDADGHTWRIDVRLVSNQIMLNTAPIIDSFIRYGSWYPWLLALIVGLVLRFDYQVVIDALEGTRLSRRIE